VPTSMGSFSGFPWDPSVRQAVSNAIVPFLSFHDNFSEALSGTPAGNFALVATGHIAVSAGNHQFCTTSQDGSWLFVDDSLVVSNEYYSSCWYYSRYYGYYGYCMYTVCQYIFLSEGIHPITVNFFKQQADLTGSRVALEVSMDGTLINLNGKAPQNIFCFGCLACEIIG
jgi:hypothetical protein